MAKMNCWEVKNCGRQTGGAKATELGVCPAATETELNGVNSGVNGGRACWAIAGTLCGAKIQGTYAEKESNCLACELYQQVKEEEDDFSSAKDILEMISD